MIRLTYGIERACILRPNEPAVIDVGPAQRRVTWAEFRDRVARLASAWRRLGLAPGGRVAILADSSFRYLEVYFAALWAGGVLAPVNSRFARPEMVDMLADCTPSILVADAASAERALDLQRELGIPLLVHAEDGAAPPGMHAYEELVTSAEPMPDAGRSGDDLACLFYTGGTTGRSKGVMLSHTNLGMNAMNSYALGLSENAVHLHCGPLFHLGAGGRVFGTTTFAGTNLVLPRFDAQKVLETLAREKPTHAVFVPAMLQQMLARPDFDRYDLSSVKVIAYGAAPMPGALIEELMRRVPACSFLQSYGQTELSPVATTLAPWHHVAGSRFLRSVGRVNPNVELRIVDADDHPLPPGAIGEIVVRGPTVMLGYWRREEETARALRGGWMHTGDAGYLDEGFLFLVDRLKDMIVSGGENVYSAEVENVIHDHPAVAECAVFGIPHETWGEAVHAVVVTRPDHTLTAAELIAHCRTAIAGYKVPKSVEIRSEPLPKSGASKIQKTELRAPWWTKGGLP
jgi:long-chain acyl-CoA synthetase